MRTAIIVVLLALACNDKEASMKPNPSSIEAVLGVVLPAPAGACHFHSETAMGLFAYLRCEIPSDTLGEFLRTSPIFPSEVGSTQEPISFASYNQASPWWKPSELQAPRYGSKRGQRGKWQTSSYLAADRRGDKTILYFLYIEER